jgi:hypothetical protein
VAQSKGSITLIYAGINSSLKDRENGKNEHFRIFGLQEAAASKKGQKAAPNKVSELLRTKLFAKAEKETYQRVLRLSKSYPGSPQLGAAATAFAGKEQEIVLFDTAGSPSLAPNVRGRIQVDQEAEDADLIQVGKDEYYFAYCTKYDVFLKAISSKTTEGDPTNISPATAEHEREKKPVFRSVRFLSPRFLLMLVNLAGRKGAMLQVLRLPTKPDEPAKQAQSFKLPDRIRQATGVAICNLSPSASPSDELGYAQFVVAVAGHDMSISLYTCEHQREGPVYMVTPLKVFQTLNAVHPFQITGVSLSTFTPPTSVSPSQCLKLASISAGNTVIVHTIPLSPLSNSSPTRYIIRGTSNARLITFPVVGYIILSILFAIFVQILYEIRFNSPTLFNAANNVQPDIQGWVRYSHPAINRILGTPAPIISYTQSRATTTSTIPNHSEFTEKSFASALDALISQQAEKSSKDGAKPVIVIQEYPTDSSKQQETNGELKSSLKANLHDEAVHGPHGGKTWEELTHEEKEKWTQRFKDAGHWAEDFGDTILKGVVFGAAGAAVGAAVGG